MRTKWAWKIVLVLVPHTLLAQMAVPVVRPVNEMVQRELIARGMPGADHPFRTLWDMSNVPAQSAIEGVEVIGQEWDPLRQLARVRLRCLPRPACVPFAIQAPMTRDRFELSMKTARAGQIPNSILRGPKLVAPGERISLIVVARNVRLTMPVTCLESGQVGQQVRLRGDSGKILRGRVIGRRQVEAGAPIL